jgi:predicted DNA-binding protein
MKPNNAELKIRLPIEIKEKIELEADAQMRTPSSFVRTLLERYFYPDFHPDAKRKRK